MLSPHGAVHESLVLLDVGRYCEAYGLRFRSAGGVRGSGASGVKMAGTFSLRLDFCIFVFSSCGHVLCSQAPKECPGSRLWGNLWLGVGFGACSALNRSEARGLERSIPKHEAWVFAERGLAPLAIQLGFDCHPLPRLGKLPAGDGRTTSSRDRDVGGLVGQPFLTRRVCGKSRKPSPIGH